MHPQAPSTWTAMTKVAMGVTVTVTVMVTDQSRSGDVGQEEWF